MKRAKHAKAMGATALIVAGSMLGCAAQGPAGPESTAPIGWSADAPGTLNPSRIGAGAVPLSPEDVAKSGALQAPGPGSAPAIAIPEREELALPAETLKYRAPINSLEDVLKQSGLGPVDEAQAPPADLVKRILPQRLSQAQAASLLVKVPANMVQIEDLAGGATGELPAIAGGGKLAASSRGGRGDDRPQTTGKRGGNRGNEATLERYGGGKGRKVDTERGRGAGDWRGQSVGGRDDLTDRGGRHDDKYGDKSGGNYGDKHGDKYGDKRGGKHSDKRGHGTRWSRWGYGDADLIYASSFGWNQFIYGSSFYFFPATIFGALHFFPYTYAAGFFYPAFCPFYFSAAFFLPYCQAPVVWYGTLGLVSGCPTCPISGRPLLWMPGEVPVI